LRIPDNEVSTNLWREKNLDKVCYYYYNILHQKELDESIRASSSSSSSDKNHWERKGFTLAPICDIKRHFVTIGKEGLTCLLNNARKLVKMPKRKPHTIILKNDTVAMKLAKNIIIDAEVESDWLYAFNLDKLMKNGWSRGATVKTDGVSLCVGLKLLGANIKPVVEEPNVTDAGVRKRKRAPAAQALHDRSGMPDSIGMDESVIAFDPGRHTLLYGIQKLASGGMETYKLSCNAYYTHAGKYKADKRRAHWNEEVVDVHDALSCVSPKTIDTDRWDFYLHIVHYNLNALWDHKLHKRWAREDLRFYILKNSAMDLWLSRVKTQACAAAGVSKIRIAYGGASFSSTGPGEKNSAPTAFQFKRMKKIFTESSVNVVDEFRTTKCCATCGDRGVTSILQNVYDRRKRVAGTNWYPVRGLKRCNNTYCCKFYDRDANAALNIWAVHHMQAALEAGVLYRPLHLSRDNNDGLGEPSRFILSAV
jgi:hypothetical protein